MDKLGYIVKLGGIVITVFLIHWIPWLDSPDAAMQVDVMLACPAVSDVDVRCFGEFSLLTVGYTKIRSTPVVK